LRDFLDIRSVEEARKIFFSSWKPSPLGTETIPLTDSLGRILAKDIAASEDIPPFDRSTVDGYALFASDTFGSCESLPAMLEVVEEIPMGKLPEKNLSPGQAVRIPTGGMLPPGADACVMMEHTDLLDERTVLVKRPVAPGENVIHKGEDMSKGEILLKRGRVLRPFEIGALAALGFINVPVTRRPVVAVLSTGDEIVPPDKTPGPGQIRDINTYSLSALIKALGSKPLSLGISVDVYEEIKRHVEQGLQKADLVVVSGGTSVGTRDLVLRVFSDLRPPGVIVHGVAVKPGKPVILGVCRGKPVFGLPGHPVSALTSFHLFVKPILTCLYEVSLASGTAKDFSIEEISTEMDVYSPFQERSVTATLSKNIASVPGRQDHVRVRLRREDGILWADPVLGKSGLISTMVRSHGEIIICAESEGLKKGNAVRVRIF